MNSIQTYILNKKEKGLVLLTIADTLFVLTYLLLSIFQQQMFRYVNFSPILSALILYILLLFLSLLFTFIETRKFEGLVLNIKNHRLVTTNNDQESGYSLNDLSHVFIGKLYYLLTPYHKVTLLFTKDKKATSLQFLLLKKDAKNIKAYVSQSISKK